MGETLNLDTGPIPRPERRRGRRVSLRAPVLVIPQDGEGERFWGVAENISAGGMFVSTERCLPLYSEVLTKIVPPDGPSLHARARVVRCEGGGLGCCFVRLSRESSFHLNKWLGSSGGLGPISGTIDA
jgi:hypothetical protein